MRYQSSHKSDAERALLRVRAQVGTALGALDEEEELDLARARSELRQVEKTLCTLELTLHAARTWAKPTLLEVSEKLGIPTKEDLKEQDTTTKWLLNTFTEHDLDAANSNFELHSSRAAAPRVRGRSRSIQEHQEDVHRAMAYPEVAEILERCGDLDFNALELADKLAKGGDQPICVFGAHVLQYRGSMVQAMKGKGWIMSDPQTFSQAFLAFLSKLDDLYLPDVAYHNAAHAVDVMATTEFLMRSRFLGDRATTLDHFVALTAAALHDVGHPGKNALFHMKTMAPLAIRYNDNSILENMHVALAFQTMQQAPECNWLALLAQEVSGHEQQGSNLQQYARKGIINMVLATDMAKHPKYMQKLARMVEEEMVREEGTAEAATTALTAAGKQTALEHKLFMLETVIRAADVSNPCKPREIMLGWTCRICEEFWAQGDEERRLGLQISPMCDRDSGMTTVPKTQLGFVNFIIIPFFTPLAGLITEMDEATGQLTKNVAFWEEKAAQSATFEEIFGGSEQGCQEEEASTS